MGKTEMHICLWLENLKERDQLEDLGVDGKDNIKIFLKNITDFISLCQDGGN
jgi:hypothetical protein